MGYRETQQFIYDQLNFQATPGQAPILEDDSRITLIAGGERGGKSLTAEKKALPKMFSGKLFWLVGKEYGEVRAEFGYFIEDFVKLGIFQSASTNVDPGKIVFNEGKVLITLPTKDVQKIATEAPDGIIVAEAAKIEYYAYLKLLGRLIEKRGWMIMSGTFEGSLGWYPELFTSWQGFNEEGGKSFSLPTWSNIVIFPGGRQDEAILGIERDTPHDMFSERYGGIPCPPSNKAVPEFSNKIHVGDYKYDPNLPVWLWIDPGYAGAYAVEVIQKWPEQVVIVDEIYLQGYVTSEIIKICNDPIKNPWWKLVEGGVIDIAGKQHQAMEAPTEIWLSEANLSLRSQKVKEEYGLELLRGFLKVNPLTGKPKLLVNASCKGFISECGGCQSPVGGGMWLKDINTGKLLNRDNHACKAVIYGLVDSFGYTEKTDRLPSIKIKSNTASSTFKRT